MDAGYEVVVDGDWGPISRSAWADFQHRKTPAYEEQWLQDVSAFAIDTKDASGRAAAQLLNAIVGLEFSVDALNDSFEALWGCSDRFKGLRPPLAGDFGEMMQSVENGCRHYRNAIDAAARGLKENDTGLLHQARSSLSDGDLELLQVGGAGVDGFTPPSEPPGAVPPTQAPGYEPYPDYGGGDLDCADVAGPVIVDGDDPHGLDGDGDGIGCE